MRRRGGQPAFTLIELLVVMGIIMALAGMLLGGITAAKRYVQRAKTQTEITNMKIALTAYYSQFGEYPPDGTDAGYDGDDGNPPAGKYGSGTAAALQLRTICVKLVKGNQTFGPYYTPSASQIKDDAVVDVWGNPLRYFTDGRRKAINPSTHMREVGRVQERAPVIWSVAEDGVQDPDNNNLDDAPADGHVDDANELENDICSWNN
jgi:type II secretory pathway pseudopilin PulG